MGVVNRVAEEKQWIGTGEPHESVHNLSFTPW